MVSAEAAPALLAGAAAADVGRLLVVGGAGSLLEADGGRRVDAADFPAAWRASSLPQAAALEGYRAAGGAVDWAYLSPSDLIEPGPATGAVERGGDRVLRGPDGASRVTTGDFAAVLVDELERPTVHRARFTVRTLEGGER